MKTFFKSLKLKYLVNILLIVVFGITAQTGLFGGGDGGEHGGKRENHGRQEHFRAENLTDANLMESMDEASVMELITNEGKPAGPEKEQTHVYLGLELLALMLVHTIHHWSWFKKLFSFNHLKNNKLLSATVIFFVAMAISGLALWTEIVPREFINFKEIHEFSGQVLLGLVLIHIVQRFKWYISSTNKLFKTKTATVQA